MPAICGIDWASEWHDLRISDEAGTVLAERRFAHDEHGLGRLIELLVDLRVARVAIERPDGLLVGRLLAAGICVLAIHPNQVAAARDRFRAAAGKSDRFDAMVLCELARTDHHRFPILAPCSDETLALRALVRTREDLVAVRVHLANQLRAQLDAFWPGAARIFAAVDSPIALAFLARYPAPEDARGLGPKRLAGLLTRHASRRPFLKPHQRDPDKWRGPHGDTDGSALVRMAVSAGSDGHVTCSRQAKRRPPGMVLVDRRGLGDAASHPIDPTTADGGARGFDVRPRVEDLLLPA